MTDEYCIQERTHHLNNCCVVRCRVLSTVSYLVSRSQPDEMGEALYSIMSIKLQYLTQHVHNIYKRAAYIVKFSRNEQSLRTRTKIATSDRKIYLQKSAEIFYMLISRFERPCPANAHVQRHFVVFLTLNKSFDG